MAEESKSGGSSSDADPEVDAEQEGEASRGGGDASRTSRSGPPSVSFPLLTSRELLEQHVDAQLQQLETGEIRELSLQTIWTMDVLASTQLALDLLCIFFILSYEYVAVVSVLRGAYAFHTDY